MGLSRVPGPAPAMARSLHVERAAPCLHFEAVRGEDGALRDFAGTSLNAAAEALVRDFRLGRQQPLWTPPEAAERGAVPGLLDFHALVRVVEAAGPTPWTPPGPPRRVGLSAEGEAQHGFVQGARACASHGPRPSRRARCPLPPLRGRAR